MDTNGYEYLEFGLWHPKVRTKNPGRGQCQEIPPACYLWCWGLFHCWFGCRPELLTFCFKCVWRCHAKRFWFLNQNCLRPTYRTDQDWSAMPIRATCQVPSCMIHLWESRQKGHWFGSRDSPYTACIGLSWFVSLFFGRCCIFVPNDSPHFICLFVLLTSSNHQPKDLSIHQSFRTLSSSTMNLLFQLYCTYLFSGHEGIICIEIFMHIHWHVRARTHTHPWSHNTYVYVCVWMYIHIYIYIIIYSFICLFS